MKTQQNNNQNRYQVQKALQMRLLGGNEHQKEYLIKWEGYPIEECTWEPHWSLFEDCKEIIDDYKKQLKKFKEHSVRNDNTKYKYLNDLILKTILQPEKKYPFQKKNQIITQLLKRKSKKEVQINIPMNNIKKMKVCFLLVLSFYLIINIKDQESINVFGSLEQDDQVDKILEVRKDKHQHRIQFLVSWHKRKNGIQPEPSQITNQQLREHNKNILLDFYESKLQIKEIK